MNKCYHLCSQALKANLLCHDEDDYKAIWNILLVCAIVTDLKIYCICLMSNHFHILVSATEQKAEVFFSLVKRKVGRHLKSRYGQSVAGDMKYKLFPVLDRRSFCREVAYILRNPYKAGFSSPLAYRWSSASAYVNPYPCEGKSKSDIHTTELRIALKTRLPLPDTIRITEGAILPSSCVDGKYVEKMFDGSPVQFFNLLKTWNLEDVVNESHGMSVPDAYTDEEVLKGIRMICQDTFGGIQPGRLDKKSLATLTRKVYARFGCPRSQLLRLLPVDEFLLDRIL